MWEICGQQGASLFVSIWTSQAHQADIFSAQQSEHTCSHLELSFPKLKDMCDHFSFDHFLVGLLHTQKSCSNEVFSLQPAEAQSCKQLSAGCKEQRGWSKHQEMFAPQPSSLWGSRDPQHCRGIHRSVFTTRDEAAGAGRSPLAQPSRKTFPAFARRLRVPEMTRHINTSPVLAYWSTFCSWVISQRAH